MTIYTKRCTIRLLKFLFSIFGGLPCQYGCKKCRDITYWIWRYTTTFLLSCERTAFWSILGPRPKDYLQFTGTRDRTQRAPGWSRAQRLQRGSQGPGLRRERRKPRNLGLFWEQPRTLLNLDQRLPRIQCGHVDQRDQRALVRTLRTHNSKLAYLQRDNVRICK